MHMSPPGNRNSSPDQAIASGENEMPPPWSSLPPDLVQLVGWRVLAGDLLDYVRFRAVCSPWRSGTVRPAGRGIVDPRFHPRPWMMLPQGHHAVHPADGKTKRFFNLSTGSFARVRLPPRLTDHLVLVPVDGLLLLWKHIRLDGAMVLLHNPFTGDTVEFPPGLIPLLHSYWEVYPSMSHDLGRFRMVKLDFVASLSVGADGTPALVLVHSYMTCVFFATTKDRQWNVSTWDLTRRCKPLSSQGKLYILEPQVAMCSSGQRILQLDPPRHEHGARMPSSLMPPTLIATCPTANYPGFFDISECEGDVLLIGSECCEDNKLVVYKLAHLAIGKFTPLTTIGGNTVFLDITTTPGPYIGDISISRSMTSSYGLVPTITSDTIVGLRHQYPWEDIPSQQSDKRYPWEYHLPTGKWSRIMGECPNNSDKMAHSCLCGLIYHIYHLCHCIDRQDSWYLVDM